MDENHPGRPLPKKPGHVSSGRLGRILKAGHFAITVELAPPDSALAEDVYERAQVFDGYVDGMNATDGSGANCHMSSVAMCALLTGVGYSPVMQIACRDRNRIAIQGDVLGAAAMGVSNVLCLTGDGVQVGDQPEAKPVFDIPDHIIERLATAENQKLEGQKICVEPIQQIREIPGVSGVHIMAYRQEEAVADIIKQSGVLQGRVPWYPGCENQTSA